MEFVQTLSVLFSSISYSVLNLNLIINHFKPGKQHAISNKQHATKLSPTISEITVRIVYQLSHDESTFPFSGYTSKL